MNYEQKQGVYMTYEQKQEIYRMTSTSYPKQILKYAEEKGYDIDIVFSIIVQSTYDDVLNSKLGIL